MPGFDGLEDAKKILKKAREKAQEKNQREFEMAKRVVVGDANEEDLAYIEKWYQEMKKGMSPAYFSGSMFNVGESWTKWYKQRKIGSVSLGEAIVYGAAMRCIYKR